MRKVLWLGAALSGVLILAMITGFQPLYWLVYLVVGGIVLGYLWLWLQSRGLEIRVREMSPHPQVGSTVHLEVTVREKLGLPRLGLRARLVGDFVATDEDDFSLPPRGTTTWTASGLCNHRGLNTIGSLTMISTDPAGLLRLECTVGTPQSILVYPATIELSRAVVQGQAIAGELGGAGQLMGQSPVASMVRQYAPGDSLTHIHWPTTARLERLMTKEFEGAGTNEIWLILDLQEAVQAGTGEESTEEYGIVIAASLARSLIQAGHAVGLIVQGDQFYRLSPSNDPNHIWALLESLALVKAKGRTPLPTLITREGGDLGPGTAAIVITPWPGESVGNLFRFLMRRGILVVPIFLDAASFDRLPDSRWLSEARTEVQDWASLLRKGDDLSISLGSVLDTIASY